MEVPLSSSGSQSQVLREETTEDSIPEDISEQQTKTPSKQTEEDTTSEAISEQVKESMSQDLNEQGEDNGISPAEQAEDNKAQDLKEQDGDEIKDKIETLLETSDQKTPEEEERSQTHVSRSWERSTADWKDDLSSLLATEPDTSTYYDSLSLSNKMEDLLHEADWMGSQVETPAEIHFGYEEALPCTIRKKPKAGWKDEVVASSPVTECKLSFHDCCCYSAAEQMIKHSPLHPPKAPRRRNFIQKYEAQKFLRNEINSVSEGLPKQRFPLGITRKKECVGFTKVQLHQTSSSGSHKGSGRRSKALYKLYTTFYDEGEQFDPCLVPGAKGLSRACTIFSAIKKGKININHLLLTLHTLGILMAGTEMHEALQCVPVDAHGNLDFADFLDIVHCILPYTETEALRNAQKIFRRIKRDMVNVEDLEQILASLGVSLDSKTIQLALGCTQITWDGRVNISEFLKAVKGPLSYHKELDEYTPLAMKPYQGDSEPSCRGHWSTLNREMPPGHPDLFTFYDPHKEIDLAQLQEGATKFQKSVDLRKLKTASPVHQAEEKVKRGKGIEWPKIQPRFRYSSQDTLFPLSSTLYFKEETSPRHAKATSLSPSVAQKAAPAPSSITQSVNHETFQQKTRKKLSFQERLPRRYGPQVYNIPMTNSSKPGRERKVHSEAQSALQAFQDVFGTICILSGENVRDHELYSTLKKLGVSLNDKEFQELLQKANVAEDGTVNFNSFMFALGKTRLFSELTMLKDAIQAIDKIEGDQVVVHELPSFMRSMGVRVTDQEFQQALKQIPVDGNGKVFVRDFIEVLTRTLHFTELSVLKDTIKGLSDIQGNKVALQNLKSTLKNMGICFYPQEYEDLIQTTPTDGEGNIDIDQIIRKISKTQRFIEIEVLNNAIKTFSQFKDEQVSVSDMQTCLRNIGVHLTESELEESIMSLKVSSDGMVDVKELTSAVKGTGRFQNYSAVLEVISALKFLKEHTNLDSTWGRRSLNTFRFKLANEVISQVLKAAHMTEAGWAKFNNFLRILTRNPKFKTSAALANGFNVLDKLNNGRIGVDELHMIMKSFSINLPSEDLSEALAYCNIDDNETVKLNDFLRGVAHTDTFIINPGLQLTCMALSKCKDNHLDLQALESTLNTMDLPKAKELLQDVMKMAQVDNNGTVDFAEFMRIFIVVSELPEATVLKDTFDAMSNLKGHQVHVDELPQTLASVGLNLTPEELQSLSKSLTAAGDGTVGFEDVMINMTGAQSSAEFTALQNAFRLINKAFAEKIKKEDLLGVLEGLGIQLSPDELQAVLASASSDGELDGIEVLKILSNVPCISESKALQDATKVVESLTDEKMTVQELKNTLSRVGVHLPNTTFNELVKSTKADKNGRIDFKDFLMALGETDDFTELEALQRAITITGTMHGSQQQMHEVQDTLGNLGIHLTNEEFQQIVNTIDADSDGTIKLEEFLMALSKTQRFRDSLALHSAVETFGRIKGEKVDTGELETIVSNLGINLSNLEFQKALKNTYVDEDRKANFKEFLVNVMDNERFCESSAIYGLYSLVTRMNNDKVHISHLKDVLAAIGITLNKEEMKDVMKNIMVDDNGKVPLKEFMRLLLLTQRFSTAVEMDRALKAMQSIKQDKVNIEDLDSIMRMMGLHLSLNEIQQTLKYVVQNVDGTVSLRDFMFGFTKTQRFSKAKSDRGDMVAIVDVASHLSNMGICLTQEQLQEALRHVDVDENGKVSMTELLGSAIKTWRPSQAVIDWVKIHNLDGVLANMGIYLTDDEVQQALKYAAKGDNVANCFKKAEDFLNMKRKCTEDGRVNLNDFMKGVKSIQLIAGAEGQMIDAGDLSSTLVKMGINLTEDEMQEALEHVTLDADGNVNLKDVLQSVMLMQRPSKHERDRVSTQNLDSILTSTGIHLTEDKLQEALKNTPLDAEGKMNLGEFMKWVRTIQLHPQSSDEKIELANLKEEITVEKAPPIMVDGWTREKKIDIDHLDEVLDEMGISLTNKQLYEALKYAPMDADGKVDLEAFKRGASAVLTSERTGKKLDVSKLESLLACMGLHLTQEEVQEALKKAILNKNGTVNLKDFMWAVQDLSSIQDKQVDIKNLESILGGMGIYLTQEELQDALKSTKCNEDGTVNLKDFMKSCNATLTPSSTEVGRHPSKMSDIKTLKFPKVTEKHRPLIPGRIFSYGTPSGNVFKAVKDLSKPQLEAFRHAYDTFSKDLEGNVDLPALETTAHNLGINLTEEEAFDELIYADTDGDGKVNFTDFLNIITDSNRFIQAVAPKNDDTETVDARGILFFELLSKLVETCMLPRKTTVNIVSYYRQKFLESTGKKAWRADSIDEDKEKGRGGKKKHVPKARSTPLSSFAGAARICIMNDKELEDYVEHLRFRATMAPSDSPYAQVPIFPLIPNQDGLVKGRPKADLQKLEVQRRMEPISSFEDQFFHKKRWLQREPKLSKNPKPSLILTPGLTHKSRRLTMDNLDEIRREVKRTTDAYRKAIALRERNKTLKLWRRLRGGEIGLESGNPSFYQTFSTYSWSWNVCQELVTPRELREYDKKLYHRHVSRTPTFVDKHIRASGREKGNE